MAEATERICMECNKPFRAKNDNFMCQKCIRKVIAESQAKPETHDESHVKPGYMPIYKTRTKKPQIVLDAKKAKELGMSYGQYMADVKGKGKGRR